MASANKTDNLKLNIWESEDKPERLDFNADNRTLDAAFGAVAKRNILDNWEFMINQRGEAAYTGPCYGLDRGYCAAAGYYDGRHFWRYGDASGQAVPANHQRKAAICNPGFAGSK